MRFSIDNSDMRFLFAFRIVGEDSEEPVNFQWNLHGGGDAV